MILLTLMLPAIAAEPWNVRDHVPLEKFTIQSHRGAGELEAENTMQAFELGWKLGTIPEADVRATKDGVICAFHDNDFKRLVKDADNSLKPKGIKDLPWAEVAKLDVGSWKGDAFTGRRVPKLADVFAVMTGKPERRLYLDIKEIDLPKLADLVKAAKVESQVILATSKHGIIREWKTLVPESGTLHWMGGTEEAIEKRFVDLRKTKFEGITQLQIHAKFTMKDGVETLSPSADFLRKRGEELRERGILFQSLPWGSTDEKHYWTLLDCGVMSFATDYPKITLEAVKKYYARKARP